MKVLICCEHTGTVRDAFAALGHDAWSCDLLPSEAPGKHLQCDLREAIQEDWDFIGFHTDCTYMANASVRWLTQIPKKPKKGILYGPPRWRMPSGRRCITPHPERTAGRSVRPRCPVWQQPWPRNGAACQSPSLTCSAP